MYKFDGDKEFKIADFDCADTGEFTSEEKALEEMQKNQEKIFKLQQKLYAEKKEGVIFVLQAMDAAGKDGAIRSVFGCLSPQGAAEHAFKTPTPEETRHDYLWRFWKALPEKGCISIFNRSYYEDVLCQKVHKYYMNYDFADRINKDKIIDKRYGQIRNFEEFLWENSTRVVKIFLNVSKREQALRFVSRIDCLKKNWKASKGDVDEREYWDQNMEAFEMAINETATKHCPWYVVPADNKWYARYVISKIVLKTLEDMDLKWPEPAEADKAVFSELRAKLVAEENLTEEETKARQE